MTGDEYKELLAKKRGKYNASRASFGGRTYHSARERDFAMALADHVKAGRLADVKEQHKIVLNVNGKHVTTHVVDFLVTLPDGRQKYVEVKGFATNEWGIKKRLVEAIETIPYLVNPTDKELLS